MNRGDRAPDLLKSPKRICSVITLTAVSFETDYDDSDDDDRIV